jgi:hypothetical protein
MREQKHIESAQFHAECEQTLCIGNSIAQCLIFRLRQITPPHSALGSSAMPLCLENGAEFCRRRPKKQPLVEHTTSLELCYASFPDIWLNDLSTKAARASPVSILLCKRAKSNKCCAMTLPSPFLVFVNCFTTSGWLVLTVTW